MMNNVSIIVPVNEDSDDLKHLLSALLDQTLNSFEVIIVDSSDPNDNLKLIESFKNSLDINYHRIPFAFPGEARNIGVKIAKYKIISFLDVRTIPAKDWLKDSITYFSNRNFDFVGGNVVANATNFFQRLLRASSYGEKPVSSIAGSIMKTKFFNTVGKFNSTVRAGEDQEWLSRINFSSPHVTWNKKSVIEYAGLPKNIISAIKKWFNYSMSSSKINIQVTQKFLYFFVLFTICLMSVYSWNLVIAGREQWTDSPYFIPHITKIFVGIVCSLYFILRGLVNPALKGSRLGYLLPFNFVLIGTLGIILDIVKAPGRILGSLSLMKTGRKKEKAYQTQDKDNKKILVLCPYPYDEAAGQRLKYEQYFYDWKERGIDITLSPFFSKKTWNILYKEGYLLRKIFGTFSGYFRRILDLKRVHAFDKVYIFMWIAPIGGIFLEKIFRSFAKKLIFDFDDSIHLFKNENQNDKGSMSSLFKSTKKTNYMIRFSDAVITSSENNLTYCSNKNLKGNAFFIPCSLNTERFIPKKLDNRSRKITIGWTGTFSSIDYLDSIKNVFYRINEMHDVNFRLITNFEYVIPGINLEIIPWNKSSEIEDLHLIDIGLYPLVRSEWALGKGGLKVMQYMSIGIPSVSTDFGMASSIITNEIDGFLVNTEDEWVSRISELIDSEDLRRSMGVLARKKIVENFSTEATKLKYRDALEI